MKYANVNGVRTPPTPKLRGYLPTLRLGGNCKVWQVCFLALVAPVSLDLPCRPLRVQCP